MVTPLATRVPNWHTRSSAGLRFERQKPGEERRHVSCKGSRMPLALLVETDPALSQLMQQALVRAGFEVRACGKASWVRPALLSFNEIPNEDLLFVLSEHVARVQRAPLLSALKARFLSQETPLRTVFTADFASPEPLPDLQELDVAAVLQKPFAPEELERIALRIRLSMSFTLFPVD